MLDDTEMVDGSRIPWIGGRRLLQHRQRLVAPAGFIQHESQLSQGGRLVRSLHCSFANRALASARMSAELSGDSARNSR